MKATGQSNKLLRRLLRLRLSLSLSLSLSLATPPTRHITSPRNSTALRTWVNEKRGAIVPHSLLCDLGAWLGHHACAQLLVQNGVGHGHHDDVPHTRALLHARLQPPRVDDESSVHDGVGPSDISNGDRDKRFSNRCDIYKVARYGSRNPIRQSKQPVKYTGCHL